jgi:Tol biopolymer transport system component
MRRLLVSVLVVAAVVAVVGSEFRPDRLTTVSVPTARVGIASEGEPLTIRANVSTLGRQSNGWALGAALSADGRCVAFASRATTLVRNDHNRTSDVFVRDLWRERTVRVSLASSGREGNGASVKPSISADCRLVAFPSAATNLAPGDRNGLQDIFVRDRVARSTTRVSVGCPGEPNGTCLAALISSDGSVVAFSSGASNLVPGDRNGALDVFVHDLRTRLTRRVSVGYRGEADGRSEAASVSHDGRLIAFRSLAANLVRDDRNGYPDVFVYDRATRLTERVNLSSSGVEANRETFRGMLSGNGRFVGFRSRASNLVWGDTNNSLDVFVHDRVTGRTQRISVSSGGDQANSAAFGRDARDSLLFSRPFLSGSGRFAAFTSRATNLVLGDRNGVPDVFVRDRRTGRTIRVSLAADGAEANNGSFASGISADGRIVAFQSDANNLVPGDTNGRKDVFVAVDILARLGVDRTR